ncbi:MAG TPA: hypothetical protein VGB85_30410 [Nannocystis sp.]|jgi:hypothetical protein
MSAAEPSRARRLARWLPFAIVTAFGLWLLWPVPSGVMPLSADHTVHLTRAHLYAQQLAGGHLVGWSPAWFFGFPLGELYPVLGDLGVLALRILSLGTLDWPQCYALLFTLVFLTQGWALLRCGRALGWGPVPGTVAGLLVLADVGAYREGGWMYTVTYGVWPQALATALAWLAFAELALATRGHVPGDRSVRASDDTIAPGAPVGTEAPVPGDMSVRHLVYATLAAAGALLAHPMAILMFALAVPLWLVTVGLRGADRRARLADAAVTLALVLGLGAALAAWWLLPMSAHRGWMASYGWLHASLGDMARMASKGQWTYLMAPAVGHMASLGLVLAALIGRGPLRFFALWTVAHWLLASTDLFWGLRLDWLSGGFQHIQYQRFLIAAKPGFFLLAGAVVGAVVHLALRAWSQRHDLGARLAGIIAGLVLSGAVLSLAWQAGDVRTMMLRHQVGVVQTERVPGQPAFAADYAAFLAWARATWDARDHDYRVAFRADRNLHWFMDAPVTTRTPSYKIGFTPGDNFVHKPESGDPALLRRLGVRFVVSTGSTPPAGGTLVERFGKIHVFELAGGEPLAHLEGGGEVTFENPEIGGEGLRLRVRGATDETRLVIHVAGYPRWELRWQPDGGAPEVVEWFEAPVLGDSPIATQTQRRGGELRGGKALGDDGREPTLIAAAARDGVYTLRYVRWRGVDVVGLVLALLGALGLFVLTRRGDALLSRVRPLARRLVPPVLLLVLAAGLVLAVVRHRQGSAREHDLASARLRRGEAQAHGVIAAPLKTDMIVFPAVLVRPDRGGESEVVYPGVQLGATLDGWYALDDDDAKQRRRGSHRLYITARAAGSEPWTALADLPVTHRPDRRRLEHIAVPAALQGIPVDVQVSVETTGEAPPKFGFDLTLPGAP